MGFLFKTKLKESTSPKINEKDPIVCFDDRNYDLVRVLEKQFQLHYTGFENMLKNHNLHRFMKQDVYLTLFSFFKKLNANYRGQDEGFKSSLDEIATFLKVYQLSDEKYIEKVNSIMTHKFSNELLEEIPSKDVIKFCLDNLKRILMGSSDDMVEEDYLTLIGYQPVGSFFIINETKIFIFRDGKNGVNKNLKKVIVTVTSFKDLVKHEFTAETFRYAISSLRKELKSMDNQNCRYIVIFTDLECLKVDFPVTDVWLKKQITLDMPIEIKKWIQIVFGNVSNRKSLESAFKAAEDLSQDLLIVN